MKALLASWWWKIPAARRRIRTIALSGFVLTVSALGVMAWGQATDDSDNPSSKRLRGCAREDPNRPLTLKSVFGVSSVPADANALKGFIKRQWVSSEGSMDVAVTRRSEAYYMKDDLPLHDVVTRYYSYKKGGLSSVRIVLTSERKVGKYAEELKRMKQAFGEPTEPEGPSRIVSTRSVRRFSKWRIGEFQIDMEHVSPVRDGDLGKGLEYRVTMTKEDSGRDKKQGDPLPQSNGRLPRKAKAVIEEWCACSVDELTKPPMPQEFVPTFSGQGSLEIDINTRCGMAALGVAAGVRFSHSFLILKGKVRRVGVGPMLTDSDTELPSLTKVRERLVPLWGEPSSVQVLTGSVAREDCEDVIVNWGKGRSLYLTRSKRHPEKTKSFSLSVWHRQLHVQ